MSLVSPEVALAINRKKLRYARYADTKQWDLFEKEVARPETQYDYQGTDGQSIAISGVSCKFAGTKQFRAFFEPAFASLQTLHTVGPGEFTKAAEDEDEDRDDEVRAIFAFQDQLFAPPFGRLAALRGGGFYYETWRRVDGDWFLVDLRSKSSLEVHFFYSSRFAIAFKCLKVLKRDRTKQTNKQTNPQHLARVSIYEGESC